MPIVATVTRASGGQFFTQQAGVNVGDSGGVDFALRKADGTDLGSYRSVSEAIGVFNRLHGRSRVLRWERRDIAGSVEQHVCIGLPLDPSEIWLLNPGNVAQQNPNAQPIASALIQWIEPAVSLGSVKLSSVTTNAISTISDLSGNGNQLVQSGLPVLIAQDASFNDQPTVDLDRATGQGFTVPNLASLAPPYTLVMVANNLSPGVSGVLLDVDPGGATPLAIRDNGAGRWQIAVGGNTRTSDVVGSAVPSLLTVKVTATETIFRVDGAQVGAVIAAVPSAGVLEIGGISTDFWDGRFSMLTVATLADADNTRILQAERWARDRFQ